MEPLEPTEHAYDFGDLGCGELLMEVVKILRPLATGTVISIATTDSGSLVDLPAWCQLTGNHLLQQSTCDLGDKQPGTAYAQRRFTFVLRKERA